MDEVGNFGWTKNDILDNIFPVSVVMMSVGCCFVTDGLLCSGHDISDGGLITCLLEMAFAGNCSVEADFNTDDAGLLKSQISPIFIVPLRLDLTKWIHSSIEVGIMLNNLLMVQVAELQLSLICLW